MHRLKKLFFMLLGVSILATLSLKLASSGNTEDGWGSTYSTRLHYRPRFDPKLGIYASAYKLPNHLIRGTLSKITSFALIKTSVSIKSLETCEKCVETECNQRCSLLQLVTEKLEIDSSEEGVRLFVVPVDFLSLEKPFGKTVRVFVDELKSSFEYRRFRGSDHVFLCLEYECTRLGKELGRALANNKGTRAIFAGRNLDEAKLEWPCPLRVINLQGRSSGILDDLNKILIASTLMIEKRNRWVCDSDFHRPNHWDLESRIEEGLINEKFGLSLCPIAKSGSTMVKMLMRRLEGYPDWKELGDVNWDIRYNGLTEFKHIPYEQKERLRYDLGFITGAVVRDPISRLLSGYLDKIHDHREYQRVSGLRDYVNRTGGLPPSFTEFVVYLIATAKNPDKNDEHFLMQSAKCYHRTTEYDFYTEPSSMHQDFKELGESLGFWEEYGASGWGKGNSTLGAFGEKSIDRKTHYSGGLIWKFYTESLIMKVYNYYKEDFDRFSFSIEEILATNPKKESKQTRK